LTLNSDIECMKSVNAMTRQYDIVTDVSRKYSIIQHFRENNFGICVEFGPTSVAYNLTAIFCTDKFS